MQKTLIVAALTGLMMLTTANAGQRNHNHGHHHNRHHHNYGPGIAFGIMGGIMGIIIAEEHRRRNYRQDYNDYRYDSVYRYCVDQWGGNNTNWARCMRRHGY